VFSGRGQPESPPLYVRTFKVDPAMLLDSLHIQAGPSASMITPIEKKRLEMRNAAVRDHFTKAGADMDSTKNPGKSIFFNDRQGMLIVRATMEDLDIIEAAIQALNTAPPQINIKAKFVAVTQDGTKALDFDWYLGNMLITNGSTPGRIATAPSPNSPPPVGSPSPTLTGILTDPQFRVVIKALQQREDGDVFLAEPDVTTLSGRQAQCKVAQVRSVVQGIDDRALTPPGITSTDDAESSAYKTESVEFGPTLDINPTVLPDGYTINLTLVASLFEFLGYEDSQTNRVTVYVNGKRKQVSSPQPIVRACQITSQVNVQDGQTLLLGGLVSERIMTTKNGVPVLGDLPVVGPLFRSEFKKTQKRNLLVFITPTITDSAGNRVHTADEAPIGRQGVAPQSPR
jgi:general secretion pathway protein D